jgi:type IV pilus assembly protein PilB
LVGEIRDEETARIAVQAALTGHLVMSSIHATDAASALFRFIDMGIEPFLVASAVVGVVGQRLVRRVCRTCTTDYRPTDDEIRLFEQLGGAPGTTFVRGQGCEYCSGTGYRDRVAAYEILEVTEEIGQKLVSGATPHEIRHLASGQGMRPVRTEAMDMVAHGITTIDEVLRNVYIA